ncbi:MAG TPA: class I SAM-dependent methyltransferase, partial [Clostridiaceae bacterium]|nr:class I SAM-dependent methyltransferase [Clostridiaceae bacterium]
MIKQQFLGVEDTLFIPLAARVAVSRRFPTYFYDAKALELANLEQISWINKRSSEYAMMSSVSRYYNMDRLASAFLTQHGGGHIISLGVGLESLNYRLSNPSAHFYSVDFPKVIEARRQILGVADNETLISGDIMDMKWTEQIEPSRPTLLIASGVLQYFKKDAVLSLIAQLQSFFKQAEMIFDATNEVGIRYAQRYVKRTGNTNAMMFFYINHPETFAKEAGVTLIEVRGFFDAARKMIGKQLNLYTRIAMKIAD